MQPTKTQELEHPLPPVASRLPWHHLAADQVFTVLGVGPDGLDQHEVTERRRHYGPNLLPAKRRPSIAVLFLRQFKNPLVYLLLAAGVVSWFIGEPTDAAFIFGVLLFNALVGTVHERRAIVSAAALKSLVPSWAVARREGRRRRVRAAELVPGDIVFIESGSRLPADLRLISTEGVQVDEASLTGESVPVDKDDRAILEQNAGVPERRNMLYAGTIALRGRASGVVTATGGHTEIGQIARALAEEEPAPPPLVFRLKRFAQTIGILMIGIIAVIGFAMAAQGTDLATVLLLAVALAVAAIPESLPAAVTIALAVATTRMGRRHVIVRSLPAVEGLGACTLIASDKTGTLTRNELTVRRVWIPGLGDLEVTGQGYRPDGRILHGDAVVGPDGLGRLRRLATAAALCNEASLQVTEDGVEQLGDTVDLAFLVLAHKAGLDPAALAQAHPRLSALSYEPQRRLAASVHEDPESPVCYVKGAPETLLPLCRRADRQGVEQEADRLAAEGYRVIAVAGGKIKKTETDEPTVEDFKDLELYGLAGLIDPLRPEARDAVDICQRAGIDVRMVTGDHPATALAIARDLGIAESTGQVVAGSTLMGRQQGPEADPRFVDAKVYARVDPTQKLVIVRALQDAGHVVTVTGDGVNDAPALQTADIGVAMGQIGTDVARSAADLILTDDNFASIVAGVEEGRVAHDNIRKVVYLLISTGAAEILLFVLAVAANLPIPLFPAQLIWLNVVTQGVQGVALPFERGEPGVLDRHPRPPDQPIFDRRMIEQTVVSGAYTGCAAFLFFFWCLETGWSEDAARNALLLLMVLFENVHILNCRSETRSVFRVPLAANPWLAIAVLAAQAAHVAVLYIPGFFQDVLRTHPPDIQTWAIVAAIALSVLVVMEAYKALRPSPRLKGGEPSL